MLARLRARLHLPSPAMVVALIALFAALGGGAYALTLPKNIVRSKHIRDKQVRNPDLGNDAVTSPKVKPGSLLETDFAAGELPSSNVTVRSTERSIPLTCTPSGPSFFTCTGTDVLVAQCEPGERATGGGYGEPSEATGFVQSSQPTPTGGTPTGWQVKAGGAATGPSSNPPPVRHTAYVVCASG